MFQSFFGVLYELDVLEMCSEKLFHGITKQGPKKILAYNNIAQTIYNACINNLYFWKNKQNIQNVVCC